MSTSHPIRLFVVGCPRSGTTLLQSLLAAHPDLVSFPETHFFNYLADAHLAAGLGGIWRGELRREMSDYFEKLGRPERADSFARWHFRRATYADLFVEALDGVAYERGADGWIEKTPSHLERIDDVERHVPGAKFIHIVRDGADVVASLHEVTHEHPDEWGGERSLDRCVDRWNRSVRITDQYVDSPNHELVGYRQLTERTEPHVRRLCVFAGVDFEPRMLEDYGEQAERVSEDHETWKEDNTEPIEARSRSKFRERFSEEERRYVLNQLEDLDENWPLPTAEIES